MGLSEEEEEEEDFQLPPLQRQLYASDEEDKTQRQKQPQHGKITDENK